MLARGGWPWTVVTMDSRKRYMEALEEASVRKNIKPFTAVISELVDQQLTVVPRRLAVRRKKKPARGAG
jgi:hypothetical protein